MIYRESCETYGSLSIWDALVKQGHRIGEHRLARLMCQDGIRAKTVKMRRAPNQSQHRFLVAENTLDRPVRIESQIGCGQETSPTSDLPRRRARSVLAPRDRLGNGAPSDRGSGRAGPHPGAVAPAPPRTGSCTTRIAAVSIPPELPASAQCARHHCEHEPTGNCWAMPAWRASSSHSSVDSSIIANTAHGTRRDRTSLSTSKRSLIGYVGTPHSATTPRPSSKRDRL